MTNANGNKQAMKKAKSLKEIYSEVEANPHKALKEAKGVFNKKVANLTESTYLLLQIAYYAYLRMIADERTLRRFINDPFWLLCAQKRPTEKSTPQELMLFTVRYLRGAFSTKDPLYNWAYKCARALSSYADDNVPPGEIAERLKKDNGTNHVYVMLSKMDRVTNTGEDYDEDNNDDETNDGDTAAGRSRVNETLDSKGVKDNDSHSDEEDDQDDSGNSENEGTDGNNNPPVLQKPRKTESVIPNHLRASAKRANTGGSTTSGKPKSAATSDIVVVKVEFPRALFDMLWVVEVDEFAKVKLLRLIDGAKSWRRFRAKEID